MKSEPVRRNTMNELLCDKLWPTVKQLARRSKSRRAAVAYVTSEEFVKFGEGDLLVVDASNQAIKSGQTDAAVLAGMSKRGAELYSLEGLHGKLLLLDGTAVIGSANLSHSSAYAMIEVAWVTDQPATVGMANSLLEQLKSQAEPIDERFLKRITKLEVSPRRAFVKRNNGERFVVPKHCTWLIGVRELVRDRPEEQAAIEAGSEIAKTRLTNRTSEPSPLRWTGRSRFRSEAKQGDTVIQIYTALGTKRPKVYRHAPILHRQDEPTCTRFFVEDFQDADETTLSWGRFKKLAADARLVGRLGPNMSRLVSPGCADAMYSLWKE